MTGIRQRTLLSLLAASLIALFYQGYIDNKGVEYTDQTFKRALLTWAVARGLNGVISVAQGTEVAIQPAGIGLNFTPGEILDPVNDLVERFSWIMLAATTSLGLQKLLIHMFASPALTALITAFLGVAVALMWLSRPRTPRLQNLLWKSAAVLIVLRLAIPSIALINEAIYGAFLEEQYQTSTRAMDEIKEKIARINESAGDKAPTTGPEDTSLLEKARQFYRQATDAVDIEAYVKQYEQAAADASEQAINLIVIFVLQTIIFPLLFLWGIVQLLKHYVRGSPGQAVAPPPGET